MKANIENNKTNMWHKITSRLEHWHKVALFLIIYDVAVVMGSYLLALWLRFDFKWNEAWSITDSIVEDDDVVRPIEKWYVKVFYKIINFFKNLFKKK